MYICISACIHDYDMILLTESLTRGPGTVYMYDDMMTRLWYDFTYRYTHMHDKCSQKASLMIFCTLYFSVIPLITFHALHTQYIFRTDPLSSGAAFHAAQVHPGELKILAEDVLAGLASSIFSGVLPSQIIMLWFHVPC